MAKRSALLETVKAVGKVSQVHLLPPWPIGAYRTIMTVCTPSWLLPELLLLRPMRIARRSLQESEDQLAQPLRPETLPMPFCPPHVASFCERWRTLYASVANYGFPEMSKVFHPAYDGDKIGDIVDRYPELDIAMVQCTAANSSRITNQTYFQAESPRRLAEKATWFGGHGLRLMG